MSEQSGVYVRVQNTDGVLWSSSRDDWAEVIADLDSAFGAEYREWLIGSLTKVSVKQAAGKPTLTVVATPAPAPVVTTQVTTSPMPASEVEAMEMAEAVLTEEAEPQFESCEVCGTPKDRWTPPGVSRQSGKKYPGFFGCPNFRNHPRR